MGINIKDLIFSLLDASSGLAVIIDPDGIISEINEAALQRFKLKREEIIGNSLFELLPENFINFRKVYLEIVLQSHTPHRFEDEYDSFIYYATIYPLIDRSSGKIEKIAIFAADRTISKRNEEMYIKYSEILSTVQSPIIYIDSEKTIKIVNEVYGRYFKKKKDDISGMSIKNLYGKDVFEKKLKKNIDKCLKGDIIHSQDWFNFPDGSKRYMLMSYYPSFKNRETVIGAVINSTDITKIKKMEDELKRLSITDKLTGIYNRAKFTEALTDEINRYKRYNGNLSLMMFDIDHFKKINDSFGHDIGDEVLKKLSKLVKEYIRDTDLFFRWGGEEFMVLLPHTGLNDATNLSERIREKIENKYFKGPNTVTCSFGVTQYNEKDTEELFTKRVDEALYESKHNGRNRVTAL